MLGYMNAETLREDERDRAGGVLVAQPGGGVAQGRDQRRLLEVRSIHADCEENSLLVRVKMLGKAMCHTGNVSCFFRELRRSRQGLSRPCGARGRTLGCRRGRAAATHRRLVRGGRCYALPQHAADDGRVGARVLHYAAVVDLAAAGLELRLHEGDALGLTGAAGE